MDTVLQLAKRHKLSITSKDQIPGFTNEKQHRLYPIVVNKLSPGSNIVEIGCGFGRSTWAWLDIMPEDINFYVVDNFMIDKEQNLFAKLPVRNRFVENRLAQQFNMDRKYLKKFKGTHKEIFDKIINQHPKRNLLKEVYAEDFESWKIDNKIKFDAVFLDGDHSLEAVTSQLEYFKDCKIICGDDYLWPGVQSAVDNFVHKNKLEFKHWGPFYTIKT